MRPIDRHKTALHRDSISLPLRLAIAKGLLKKNFTVFDYGCGHGDDVEFLRKNGFRSIGWDPFYFPKALPSKKFDFVNLGYVLNVIDDPFERDLTLVNADAYSERVTLISCMLVGDMNQKISMPHADGFISSNNTFQKYFTQTELRTYIEEQLDTTTYALKPGVFAVIKDPTLLEDFEYLNIARKDESYADELHKLKDLNFGIYDKNKKHFSQRNERSSLIVDFFKRHARMPTYKEFCEKGCKTQSRQEFNYSVSKLTSKLEEQLIRNVTEKVKAELLQKFCLRRFIRLSTKFPITKSLQKDIRNLFRTQKALIAEAEKLLFELGDVELIYTDIMQAVEKKLGIFLSEKFIFHHSKLKKLPLRLQTLVSLATYLSGYENDAKIFQIHVTSKKVSMLEFYDFEHSAVPKLKSRSKVNLQSCEVDIVKYQADKDIRLFVIKSPFMKESDPNYSAQVKFEQEIESKTALYQDWRTWSVAELSSILIPNNLVIPNYRNSSDQIYE